MDITLKEYIKEDKEGIIKILINNTWTYHTKEILTQKDCEALFEKDYFTGQEIKTFIILNKKTKKAVGFVRIFDLGDDYESTDIPLFDIRIAHEYTGQGVGKKAVNDIISYIFTTYPNKNRIEATTRIDNKAMRKVLSHCGFAKEAHYRKSWKAKGGKMYDTIGYGLLKSDWKDGVITNIDWNS